MLACTTATGEQTRSRVVLVQARSAGDVPCPRDLVETRTCPATGQCTSYAWHASYWSAHDGSGNDVRQITCQRSDGLIVYGRSMLSSSACIRVFTTRVRLPLPVSDTPPRDAITIVTLDRGQVWGWGTPPEPTTGFGGALTTEFGVET